jgi:glucose-1-phosphate adenylyltransferase
MTAASTRHRQHLSHVRTVILAGGAGKRLFPLTMDRSKPAVPLGGKYRLIDIPISNSIHSGLRKISVLTQFNSVSLNTHVTTSFNFDPYGDSFVEILAAEQTTTNVNWFQGTADAVRQHMPRLMDRETDYHLILSGDQLYRMDYQALLQAHWSSGAEATVCGIPCSPGTAPSFGLMKLDEDSRIVKFREKPVGPALEEMRCDVEVLGVSAARATARPFLASMGIYVFNSDVLVRMLSDPTAIDFGQQVLPRLIRNHRVDGFVFDGYWEDLGTIRAFYQAHIDFTRSREQFDFNASGWPIFTHARFLPPSRIGETCSLRESLVAEGAVLGSVSAVNSVIGIRSIIRDSVTMSQTLMMGADYYEEPDDLEENRASGTPDIGIGSGSSISRAIIDKNARIGENARILNEAGRQEFDGDGFYIRDGIVIVPKNGVVAPNTVI